MIVLCVGIDPQTVSFLDAKGFITETYKESLEDFLMEEWITKDCIYEALVIKLEALFGIYSGRTIRKQGLNTCLVGIADLQNEEIWSERRAQFLENGGDDLLLNPPNPRELAATLGALERRVKNTVGSGVKTFAKNGLVLKIDTVRTTVLLNNTPIHMTGREYQIMNLFSQNFGRTLTKEAVMMGVYYNGSDEEEPDIRIVDVFICKIRKKLATIDPKAAEFIETLWGQGYQLVAEKVS